MLYKSIILDLFKMDRSGRRPDSKHYYKLYDCHYLISINLSEINRSNTTCTKNTLKKRVDIELLFDTLLKG